MKRETGCMVCQQKIAVHRCRKCGGMVCEQHYTAEKGICVRCAAGIEV